MSRYLIIIEKTAAGSTRKEVEQEMHDAIEFHIEGLRLAGEEVPEPITSVVV